MKPRFSNSGKILSDLFKLRLHIESNKIDNSLFAHAIVLRDSIEKETLQDNETF